MNQSISTSPDSHQGVNVIRKMLKTMPSEAGVYRMINKDGEVLYVGKAKNLKKRVTSYTHLTQLSDRIRRMVSQTASMEIITTYTEAEALLLEANLIKSFKPRFNILLRDDKTYPWLVITKDEWPRIDKHRGKVSKTNEFWGPFASVWAVNQTLELLQKIFLLRTCSDSEFQSRTRPCLLYQIKRCSGPCDNRITATEYQQLIQQAREFLSGQTITLQQQLAQEMEKAAANLDYERAAALRDRIRAFTYVRSTGVVNPSSITNADIIAFYQAGNTCCIQVFFIRGSRNNGNRAFFPDHTEDQSDEDIVTAFIGQFYENKTPPPQLLLNIALSEEKVIREALSLKANHKVTISIPQKGEKKAVIDHAVENAKGALERKLAETESQKILLEKVKELFLLPDIPNRIEVYDNSHIMGSFAYGCMIVAGPEGFIKSAYRKFSIKSDITPGDDFGMMREVLSRRFSKQNQNDKSSWPDMLLIDGGAGQFSAVESILSELNVTGVALVGIAKGKDRNAGREWFFTKDQEPFQLPINDPVLYYLQRLRDEAHRFAITTHRSGRSRAIERSELDDIPGIGMRRKKLLLNHFGSAKGVKEASLSDFSAIPGINEALAETIYGHFRPGWHKNNK
ncbi:excinuclease ABC subunit UvrC [Commensalibacter oyaizuii]|uniref:UvrABC system protein C n=1 Tax=Commensalibacter oyaizuii TaxID=3043873 RepID=A0ABT6PZE2_9PROT|nr:excinuclease ABC subunit UvrC [Commensalibacter sp. TBRC 16381]MDI2090226.1 excinuclease ABC subunit UvrC [Commensalibacter sp. TBRC 16381]